MLLLALLTCLLVVEAYAQVYDARVEPPKTVTNSIILSFGFSYPSVTLSSGYDNISILGLPNYGDPGEPILPFRLVRVLIPQHKQVESIEVYPDGMALLTGKFNVDYGKTSLPLSSSKTVQDEPDEAIYGSTDPFPSQPYSDVMEQYLDGYRILLLRLHPVLYIPKNGQLYCYETLTLRLSLKDTNEVSPLFRGLPEDAELVRNLVENPDTVATYQSFPSTMKTAVSSLAQSYEYVIITNSALNSSFQPLINWKISEGLTARTVLMEDIMKDARYNADGLFGDGTGSPLFNDTQVHIRNFIKDAYLNWGTKYVLLGGDDGIIPVRGIYDYEGDYTDYSIPCDMYYGALDGSWDKNNDTIFGEAVYHWNGPENATAGEEADFFAEVYIGRATVNTPQQAANFVGKTLAYEQSPQAVYLDNALMVGQALDDVTQGANGEDTIAELMPQYTMTRLYDRDGTYSKSAVVSALNSGIHVVTHDGHSNYRIVMSLTSADIDALTNTQYFFVYSMGCFSAAFDTALSGTIEAVGEHFITATHGAFAYLGNSRYGWYCPASDDGPGERYARSFFSVLNSGTRNLGKVLQLSKEEEPLLDRWTYFTLNLLGDPETEIVTSLNNPTAHLKTRTDLLAPPHIGGTVNVTGTAKRGNGSSATFSNYALDFGNGTSPASWMTTGITLANNGQTEVTNSTLATWNTEQLTDGLYTLRLTVFGGGLTGTDRWIVTVNKHAASIYVRADGTVDPPTAFLKRNGDTYALSSSLICDGDGIIIQKDSITLTGAGYTIIGSGSGKGVSLVGRHNVTVRNVSVASELYGIHLEDSYNNSILDCATENGKFGIFLLGSANNSLASNNVTGNYFGISLLSFSNNNTITQNQVTRNTGSYATGVYLYVSSNNSFFHNVFSGNTIQRSSQVYDAAWDCSDPGLTAPSVNSWDNGYPSGGNYWSDYNGSDVYRGAYQNETGSDSIGDQPYVIDSNETLALNNVDRYPLMTTFIHDISIQNITASKTVVGTGYNVTIRVWIRNEGSLAETFNATVGLASTVYETLATFTNVNLASGATTILSYTWNTTSWPLGNYTLIAYVSPVQGEVVTGDNSFFGGVITVSIVGDVTGMFGIPDGIVNMRDVGSVARLFLTKSSDPAYNPNYDINDDGWINMYDIGAVARHFGEHS